MVKRFLITFLLVCSLGLNFNSYSQVPQRYSLMRALSFADKYTPDAKYVVLIDWRLPADKHRLFIIDRDTKSVIYSWYTSHGVKSGNLAKASSFSNVPGSHKSSLGLMLTAETYISNKFKALSLRLDGISPELNGNVRKRAIVLHPAEYVSDEYMKTHKFPGRSHGCITVKPNDSEKIIKMIQEGTLIVNNY